MRVLVCLAALLVSAPVRAADPLRVGVVLFDGFLSAEVVAPLEVFTKASSEGSHRFEVITVAVSGQPVRSNEGLVVQPSASFATCPRLDVLIVPSTLKMDSVLADKALISFIKERGAGARYLASHCAGAFLLGEAGLLDGKRATTYVGGAGSLQTMCPRARVEGDKQVVVDGNLVTSIGGAVSYEGSLALLERIAGAETADRVADALYYFRWKERKVKSVRRGTH